MKKLLCKLQNNIYRQILFCAISLFIMSVVYCILMHIMSLRFDIVDNQYNWIYQIETCEIENAQMTISGWAFEPDSDLKRAEYEIILQDISTGSLYYPKMTYNKRADVASYFNCDNDFSQSGFQASYDIEGISSKNQVFRVLIRGNNRSVYCIDAFICNGIITRVNPLTYSRPELTGTELEFLNDGGALLACEPTYGVYIYQYGWDIYWIIEKDKIENETYLQYHLNSLQKSKFTKEQLNNGFYYDSRGFKFVYNEKPSLRTEQYKVAVKSLPAEYSVAWIRTGNYTTEQNWNWKKEFLPQYDILFLEGSNNETEGE